MSHWATPWFTEETDKSLKRWRFSAFNLLSSSLKGSQWSCVSHKWIMLTSVSVSRSNLYLTGQGCLSFGINQQILRFIQRLFWTCFCSDMWRRQQRNLSFYLSSSKYTIKINNTALFRPFYLSVCGYLLRQFADVSEYRTSTLVVWKR